MLTMRIKTLVGKIQLFSFVLYLLLLATHALGKVSEQEAIKLQHELTPLGAEKGGNSAGTIPAYAGNILGTPSWVNYAGTGNPYPDMYPDEKPLFYITAGNMDKYQEHLTPGLIQILKQYPDSFKLPVYTSHRDARFSKFVHENTFKNATMAALVNDIGVANAFGGPAFPIPQNGAEVMWNHLTAPRPYSYEATYAVSAVFPNGDIAIHRYHDVVRGPFHDPTLTEKEFAAKDVHGYFVRQILEPARHKGEVILIHEHLNQALHPRAAWVYLPGTRRVRRAPMVGYDNPSGVGGLRTDDEILGFNGALDRYDWKVNGKKELFISYNNYKFENPKLTYKQIMQPKHPDPMLFRFELHRCWIVEANLKSDARHVYPKRFFYLDEDTWAIHLADNYDGKGTLWRSQIISSNNAYDLPGITTGTEVLFDFVNTAYVIDKLHNEEKQGLVMLDEPFPESYFTPANLRKIGSR